MLAQPDPDLAERTIAALADGTPLVTRKAVGQGQVVLFHVTANAEWSTLPLSGLFVQMLERLAVSTRPAAPEASDLAGQTWVPEAVLDAFGAVADAGDVAGRAGRAAGRGDCRRPGAGPAAGALCRGGPARGAERDRAGDGACARRLAGRRAGRGLGGDARAGAEGRFPGRRRWRCCCWISWPRCWLPGRLRGLRAALRRFWRWPWCWLRRTHGRRRRRPMTAFALEATTAVVLAHVLTGDAQVDELAAGRACAGLSQTLCRAHLDRAGRADRRRSRNATNWRSSPSSTGRSPPSQPIPSAAAYAKLNRYLRTGGMILFDTRDADVAGFGGTTPEGAGACRSIALRLDIPPLEPIPADHVLTRTFYLLQDFPGRYAGRGRSGSKPRRPMPRRWRACRSAT